MKIRIFGLTLIASFFLPSIIQATPPDTVWVRTYGGSNNDIGYSICSCPDGGYLIAGYTSSFGSGSQSAYLVRINETGDTIWTRTYGGSSWDGAHFVRSTADTQYIVVGYTESFGAGGKDMYILKLDQTGDTVWTKTYGGNLQDCAYVLCPAFDGGYLIAGYRDGPSGWTKGDLWLLKLTETGDTLWTRTYGGAGEDYGISICRTLDSNYVIAGVKSYQSAGGKDVWLLKVNGSGDTVWTRSYGGALEDVGYGVTTTSDSGYIITGYINGTGPWTAGDLWLIRTDNQGDSLWAKVYGVSGEDFGFDVLETEDHGFVIAGETSTGAGQVDMWLLRTDPQGDTVWTQTYGGYARDACLSLIIDSDQSYLLAGHTSSYGAGGADVFVVKTMPDLRIKDDHGLNINPILPPPMIFTGELIIDDGAEQKIYAVNGRQIHTVNPAPGVYFIKNRLNEIYKIIKVR